MVSSGRINVDQERVQENLLGCWKCSISSFGWLLHRHVHMNIYHSMLNINAFYALHNFLKVERNKKQLYMLALLGQLAVAKQ